MNYSAVLEFAEFNKQKLSYPTFSECGWMELEHVCQFFGLCNLEENVAFSHVELPVEFVEGMIGQTA